MLNMNLLVVILLVVIQDTRQSEFTSDSLNMDCGKPLIGLVQLQTKPVEGHLDNAHHINNIFRLNKKKQANYKEEKGLAVPVLLMSNSAFSDIKGSTFNFKDINSFQIHQGKDKDKYNKLKHEYRPRDPQVTNDKDRYRKPKYDEGQRDPQTINDKDRNRKPKYDERPRDPQITNDKDRYRKPKYYERPRDPQITNDKDRYRKPKYDERPRDPEITNDEDRYRKPKYDERPSDPEIRNDKDRNRKFKHYKRPRYPKITNDRGRYWKLKYDQRPRDDNYVKYYENIVYFSKPKIKHRHSGFNVLLGKLSKK